MNSLGRLINTIEVSDFETVQHNGLLHISPFVLEETLNATFRQKQSNHIMSHPLGQSIPLCLVNQSVGRYETLALTQTAIVSGDLRAGRNQVNRSKC